MAPFLSTYINRLDRKGRISVPAQFRAALAGQPFAGIVAFRSSAGAVIEAGGIDRMSRFSDELEALDPASQRYQHIGAVLADARQLPFDPEGRVMLPPDLADYAQIGDEAAFVGQGKFFHICEPRQAKARLDAMFDARRSGAAGGAAGGAASVQSGGAADGAA